MTPTEWVATIVALRQGLETLPAAVRALPADRIDAIAAAAVWSAHEVVSHLADAEQVYGVRLRMLVTQERPFLKAYDQDAWAFRFANLETVDATLDRWMVLRRANLAVFASLKDDEWTRPGDHEETMHLGRVETPESVACTLASHTSQHLDQMREAIGSCC